MTKESLLIVTENEKRDVRKAVNYLSDEQIKKDVDLVLEWFAKQQHLPRIKLDERIIECILISRKGSVEQTKHKIDMMFSIRNAIPELAAPRDVRDPKIQSALKGNSLITIPRLNHDLTRVTVFTYKGDIEHFNATNFINFFFTGVEYRLLNDCFAGDRYVVDLSDLSLGHLTKITPSLVKYFEMYIKKAYGIRIFGIHLVNASSLLNSLLTIVKAGLSEKLKSRIVIHDSYEDLFKHIDKDILPSDFGGKERSYDEIKNLWLAEFDKDEVRDVLIEQSKQRSNEALRIGQKLDDDVLGIAGSFRKLDVF